MAPKSRKTGKPRGRPQTLYDPKRHPQLVRKFMFDHPGATIPDLERELGVSRNIIFRWKRVYADFRDALREGRGSTLAKLFASGLDAACGFYYNEEAVVKGAGIQEVRRYCPPNPVIWSLLASTYLGIMKREQHELDGKIKVQNDYTSVSDEAARKLIELAEKIVQEEAEKV